MSKQKKKDYAKSTNRWTKAGVIIGLSVLVLGGAGGVAALVRNNMIQKQEQKVYSVTFDLEAGKVKGKRGDDAVGMVAGINGEQNDFDKAYPWKAIKEVKDENGDYFIRIPKFYEKISFTAGKTLEYSVTASPKKGYNVAPAFIQGDKEIDYIDIGKYEASIDKGGHLRSISGVMPETTGHTLDAYRSLAEADGNQLFDWRGNQALQSLFVVEFANLDSQAIMAGETQYLSLVHEITAEEIAAKKVSEFVLTEDDACLIDGDTDHLKFAKTNLKHVDLSYEYTNEDEETVSVQETVTAKSVTFDEDSNKFTVVLDKAINTTVFEEEATIYINFGSYNYHKTGASDGRKGSSNGASLKSLETTAMNYRGIENWYGNTYTWCDGLATYQDGSNNKFVCVSMDATKNADRSEYKRYGVTGFNATLDLSDGIFLNKFSMTDDVGYQYDNFGANFAANTYYIGGVGGYCDSGANAGAFYVYVNDGVSYARGSVRLSCVPQALQSVDRNHKGKAFLL